MSRKSIDIAHVNLRIRESLRKRLAQEAKKHGFSLNNEIRVRLEASFEREASQSIAESAARLEDVAYRLSAASLTIGSPEFGAPKPKQNLPHDEEEKREKP